MPRQLRDPRVLPHNRRHHPLRDRDRPWRRGRQRWSLLLPRLPTLPARAATRAPVGGRRRPAAPSSCPLHDWDSIARWHRRHARQVWRRPSKQRRGRVPAAVLLRVLHERKRDAVPRGIRGCDTCRRRVREEVVVRGEQRGLGLQNLRLRVALRVGGVLHRRSRGEVPRRHGRERGLVVRHDGKIVGRRRRCGDLRLQRGRGRTFLFDRVASQRRRVAQPGGMRAGHLGYWVVCREGWQELGDVLWWLPARHPWSFSGWGGGIGDGGERKRRCWWSAGGEVFERESRVFV